MEKGIENNPGSQLQRHSNRSVLETKSQSGAVLEQLNLDLAEYLMEKLGLLECGLRFAMTRPYFLLAGPYAERLEEAFKQDLLNHAEKRQQEFSKELRNSDGTAESQNTANGWNALELSLVSYATGPSVLAQWSSHG